MSDGLYLGMVRENGDQFNLDCDHLTTHAVCLGMTGSGKTGLGIVALEELARRRTPLLVVDLKGDMLNLLLNFPSFDPALFEAWLPLDETEDRPQVAARQALLWKDGLKACGLGPDEMASVVDGVHWQLVTPGLSSVSPLDILPSLAPPEGWDIDSDPDGFRERVNGLTSALLSLVDRGGDPLSDPDHVLVASVILEHWRRRDHLDLGVLLASIADPPLTNLGALPLETFYPRNRRMTLVMALNTLIASPSFKAWTTGVPLNMDTLLGSGAAPRATIVTLAHLDDRQRQFCLTLLATELVAWMRRQASSGGLRALLYIDEVHGILPPHPATPPTKGPLLTLLKQGRAFGVGVWLATQNPVDLDYKALGNAGIKLIGRLITERDRERALEGLGMSRSDEAAEMENLVTSLAKRQFVIHDTRAKTRVQTITSRWAMSYLRGPVTTAEMAPLTQRFRPAQIRTAAETATATPEPGNAPTGAGRAPVLSTDIPHLFGPTPGHFSPWLLVNNTVTIERRTLALLQSREEFWKIPLSPDGAIRWDDAKSLPCEPDLAEDPPQGAVFPVSAPDRLAAELRSADRSFVRWRARNHILVLANTSLDCAADPGESREDFIARCLDLADRADDQRQEQTRLRFEKKLASLKKRLGREQDELDRDQAQLQSRKNEERLGMLEGLFSVLLGSRSLRTATGKATSKIRTSATKRRMRQGAEASVTESVNEIERLEDEIEALAIEMEEAIETIAEDSEAKARSVEEVPVRPQQADVVVREVTLVWS